jgi:hypothetical protein
LNVEDEKLIDWIHSKLRTHLPETCTPSTDGRPRDQEIMGWLHVVCYYPRYAKNIERMQLDSQKQLGMLGEENAALRAQVESLAEFKAYVHRRLDEAGVPTDPDSPHKAEGCRIGGRLDIVLAARL